MTSLALFFIASALFVSLIGGAPTCGSFTEFTLFPNPIAVGQTAFLRAVIPLETGGITGGVLAIKIMLDDVEVITFNNLPLCNISNAIQCALLKAGNNAINIDLPVPKIPPGTYSTVLNATLYPTNKVFCHTFDLVVQDPSQTAKGFLSYFTAKLAGTAQFANPNVAGRQIGDLVQVGPVGAAPNATALIFPWGSFLGMQGSEDTIVPYTNSKNYVWGLTGAIKEISYSTTRRLHTYEGTFAVGYVADLSKRQMDYVLLDGDFTLTWIFDQNLDSVLAGSIHFSDPYGTIPSGWNQPITVTRYGFMDVSTSDNGIIMVSANKTYCPKGMVCAPDGAVVPESTSGGLNSDNVGIIVGTILGFFFLVGVIFALVWWRRHARRYEEEAGIFSSVRKPEYGNALVVDDIIQETRVPGGSPELIPPLNRRDDSDDDYSSDSSSSDSSQLSDHRRSRFGAAAAKHSAPLPPPYSPGGPSSRQRSLSPPRRDSRRQRSPSRDSRRSISRGRDESDSYYSDAGSSASRTSDEE